jgi:hypothetical protein
MADAQISDPAMADTVHGNTRTSSSSLDFFCSFSWSMGADRGWGPRSRSSDADGRDGEDEAGELRRRTHHGPALGLDIEHPERVPSASALHVEGPRDDHLLAAADADGARRAGLEPGRVWPDLAPPAAGADPLHHGVALDAPDAAPDDDVRRGRRRPDALQPPPRPRGGVEPLGVALEPALPRRAVPADGEEAVARHGGHAVALVPLLRHVRERVPGVGPGVVGLGRLERVLVLVVAAGDVDLAAGLGAREEGPRGAHGRAAAPLAGGGVEDVDVGDGLEGARVPAPEHRHAGPHSGALREHGHHGRRAALPAPLARRHVVDRDAVGGGAGRRVAVAVVLGPPVVGGGRVPELQQVDEVLRGARGGARRGEGRRGGGAPPAAADPAQRSVGRVGHARQAVDGDVVGDARDQIDVLLGAHAASSWAPHLLFLACELSLSFLLSLSLSLLWKGEGKMVCDAPHTRGGRGGYIEPWRRDVARGDWTERHS